MQTPEERKKRKSEVCKAWSRRNPDKISAASIAWRKSQKESGLCVYCKNQARLGRTTCERHKEMARLKSKKHKEKLRTSGLCCACAEPVVIGKTHCQKCLDKKNYRSLLLRQTVLSHYGNRCTCCGETTYEFLAIDHINNNGAKHRKEIGLGGSRIYRWLKDNNYPDGFQVLCHNCNQAKGHYGECPHQRMLEKEVSHDLPTPDPTAVS
jgi:hypothetical protein